MYLGQVSSPYGDETKMMKVLLEEVGVTQAIALASSESANA